MPGDGFTSHLIKALEDPDSVSTKRLAWAFGCAKKGSDIERELYRCLRERFEKIVAERELGDG